MVFGQILSLFPYNYFGPIKYKTSIDVKNLDITHCTYNDKVLKLNPINMIIIAVIS